MRWCERGSLPDHKIFYLLKAQLKEFSLLLECDGDHVSLVLEDAVKLHVTIATIAKLVNKRANQEI